MAKCFDVVYNPFISNGVHHRFDKLDKEKKYKEMFNMLEDEETLDFLLWHMEMTTATEGPYNIVQLDEFHERGYGSCILVKEEMEEDWAAVCHCKRQYGEHGESIPGRGDTVGAKSAVMKLPCDIERKVWQMYFSEYVMNNIMYANWAYKDAFKTKYPNWLWEYSIRRGSSHGPTGQVKTLPTIRRWSHGMNTSRGDALDKRLHFA